MSIVPVSLWAQDSQDAKQKPQSSGYQLPEIEVTESATAPPVQENRSEPASISTLPRKTLETFGGPAQTNPFKALNLLPSVNTDTSDGYGLVQDQNSIRIRGQSGDTYNRLSRTINGMPLGVNVGQGAMGNFLDLENVDGLTLIRGPIPADQGFGFGNSAGALDMQMREPGLCAGGHGGAEGRLLRVHPLLRACRFRHPAHADASVRFVLLQPARFLAGERRYRAFQPDGRPRATDGRGPDEN